MKGFVGPSRKRGWPRLWNLDHARATGTDIVMLAQTAGMTKWDVEHIRTRLQRIPADGSWFIRIVLAIAIIRSRAVSEAEATFNETNPFVYEVRMHLHLHFKKPGMGHDEFIG